MADPIVQVVESSVGAVNATTIAITLTVAAGNALVCYVACDPTGGITISGVSDTLNGTYTGPNGNGSLDDINDAANERVAQFLMPSAKGGSTTVTATFSATCAFRGICVVEVRRRTSNPLDGHAAQNQQTPGTGADGVTSTTATNVSQPAILIGFAVELASAAAVNVGTGFTDQGQVWLFGGVTLVGRVESKVISAAGSTAATFTALANDSHTSFAVILDNVGEAVYMPKYPRGPGRRNVGPMVLRAPHQVPLYSAPPAAPPAAAPQILSAPAMSYDIPLPPAVWGVMAGAGLPASSAAQNAKPIVAALVAPVAQLPAAPPAVIAGFGVARSPAVIVSAPLQAPRAEIPIVDKVIIGFGTGPFAVVSQVVVVPFDPPRVPRSPSPQILMGFGEAAQPPFVAFAVTEPPSAILPIVDRPIKGFGLPSLSPPPNLLIILEPDARAPVLAPQPVIVRGVGTPTAPAGLMQPTLLPPFAELPLRPVKFGGVGVPAQNAQLIVLPLEAPAAQFPPPPVDRMIAGFGQAAQPPSLETAPPVPPTADLPPAPVLARGAGQTSQPATLLSARTTPPEALLPPLDSMLTGFGQASKPAAIFFARVAPPEGLLPAIAPTVLRGGGQAAQSPFITVAVQTPPSAERPPVDRVIAGSPTPPTQSPYTLTAPLVAPITLLPPVDAVSLGFGQATQAPSLTAARTTPPDAPLPPRDTVLRGTGVPSQSATLTTPPLEAPRASLPVVAPSSAIGAGQAAQAPTVTISPADPPRTELPPKDTVVAGAGKATVAPTLLRVPLELRPPEPPLRGIILRGAGTATQAPNLARPALEPPRASIPLLALVVPGAGRPTPPATIITIPLVAPVTSLPAAAPSTIVGTGKGASPGTVVQAPRVPPVAVLPPSTAIARGFGQAAQPPQIVLAPRAAPSAPTVAIPPGVFLSLPIGSRDLYLGYPLRLVPLNYVLVIKPFSPSLGMKPVR